MEVMSYIELVLIAFGWKLYNDVVSLAYTLNLHLIPFILVVLSNWFETAKSQDAGYAAVTALKRNEIDLYSMMLVCALFWVPSGATTITPSDANFHFQNQDIKNDETTIIEYQSSFSGKGKMDINREIAVPPGWWFIFKFTKGVTYQLKEWTKLDSSVSRLIVGFSTIKIKDPVLRSEVNDFYTACYSTTLSAFQDMSNLPEEVKASDASWLGNDLFVNGNGFYSDCKGNDATCPLRLAYSMPYKIAKRYNIEYGFDGQGNQIPRPTCKDWWSSSEEYGLRSKLLKQSLSSEFWPNNEDAVDDLLTGSWFDSHADVENNLIKRLLTNTPPEISYVQEVEPDADQGIMSRFGNWVLGGVQDMAGAMGAQINSTFAQFMLSTLIPMLPMLQAVVLMGLIVALAFVQIAGGFSISSTVGFIFAFVIVLSWTFWWHLAHLIDEGLLNFMYQNADASDAFFRSFSGTKQDIVWSIASSITYVVLPGLWSFMLGVAGKKYSAGISNQIDGFKGQANNAGNKSGIKM